MKFLQRAVNTELTAGKVTYITDKKTGPTHFLSKSQHKKHIDQALRVMKEVNQAQAFRWRREWDLNPRDPEGHKLLGAVLMAASPGLLPTRLGDPGTEH